MRFCCLGLALLAATFCIGQSNEAAKLVYDSSEDSVFLVYLNDGSGNPSALGSAFLVAPQTLITNAHVVNAGEPVLAVGPVRIPLKILKIDSQNDLAVLSVSARLTSKPLPLATNPITPGEQEFAIGNPEGLEKSISQGIVSARRKIGERDLIQITSPISHGSSGGPILNSKGQVVGVAVGMLEEGQNLNFAVPVEYVKLLLKEKDSAAHLDSKQSLDQAKELFGKRSQTTYSDDPDSDYQKATQQLISLMTVVTSSSSDEDTLVKLSCLGTRAADLSDLGIAAARKLVNVDPTPQHRAFLAYLLYDRAADEGVKAVFAKSGSSQAADANAAHDHYLQAAGQEAGEATKSAKGKALLLADYVLGSAKNDQGDYIQAASFHVQVANGEAQVCGNDLTQTAMEDLITENAGANRPDEAERWFQRYSSRYETSPYEWDAEGDRRSQAKDFADAAKAYETAAQKDSYYSYDYCYAANMHSLQASAVPDDVLADGRKCIDASTTNSVRSNDHYFTSVLPLVYMSMAEILNSRGVYQSALDYIKESLAESPNNAFALNTEAKILANLQRNVECVAAAQSAIQASDGKYPWMHFELGYCLFADGEWERASESFRISAEADQTDAVSAFDLGLCLSRQGFSADAEGWFREALKRKPDDELRVKILSALGQ